MHIILSHGDWKSFKNSLRGRHFSWSGRRRRAGSPLKNAKLTNCRCTGGAPPAADCGRPAGDGELLLAAAADDDDELAAASWAGWLIHHTLWRKPTRGDSAR